MRDRLIELIVNKENEIYQDNSHCTDTERISRVASHLLSEGVIVPSVKIGQAVYYPIRHTNEVVQLFVREVVCTKNNMQFCAAYLAFTVNAIGKTVFLTRSEAEKALERSENGKS